MSGSLVARTEKFLIEAQKCHQNFYDYSKVAYHNARTNVNVGCPVADHGIFPVTPDAHIRMKSGCPKCAGSKRNKNRLLTKENFLERVATIHEGIYDYSQVCWDSYKNNNHMVTIECKTHGPFSQSVAAHLSGKGCQTCRTSGPSEQFCRQEIERITGHKFPKSKPNFLKDGRSCLELDGFCPDISLAFEYHGRQHYESFWHYTQKNVDDQKLRDALKLELCETNHIDVIVIPWIYNIQNRSELRAYIEKVFREFIILGNTVKFIVDPNELSNPKF